MTDPVKLAIIVAIPPTILAVAALVTAVRAHRKIENEKRDSK